MTLRGKPKLVKRVIEDLQDIFYQYKNKKTGKVIGALQLVPREIKIFELAFPETAKGRIKEDVIKVLHKHNTTAGGVAVHWGPFKKDKFNKDGSEMI